jgi:sugar lactone lactonase YvrE
MSELRAVLTGRMFLESPRWRDGALWVADWGAHEALRLRADHSAEVVARTNSFPMCIEHLPDGRLLIVDSSERRLARVEADATLVTHVDLSGLSERRAIGNDIVVDGRGNIYVNDVNFDFPGEKPRPGWIALVTPDGKACKVAEGLMFPNGMAVTPDNRTLIVAESYAQQLSAFDIAADGTLSNRRVWAKTEGPPDGICIDAEGCVWYACVPSRSCIRVREGGQVVQTVETDRGAFACVLGGPERKTLFIVGQDWRGPQAVAQSGPTGQVWAIEAPAPAAGWP